MIVLPAIDLKDGKCVRLHKGDFETVHKVAEDAVETALKFREAGAEILHMVDLDGAKDGVRRNADIVKRVCAVSGIKVELGGGIRTMADIEKADELGVYRIVIGSAAVSDPDFVQKAADIYGERIAVGVDSRDGRVRIHGWTEDSGIDAIEFSKKMESLGVKTIVFTDIDTDGTLSGPPIEKLRALRSAVSCKIIASGGVANNADIKALRDIKMDGAIVGKAYYAGTIELELAIKEARV